MSTWHPSGPQTRLTIAQSHLNPLVLGWTAYLLRKSHVDSLLLVNIGRPSSALVTRRLAEETALLIWKHTPDLYDYFLSWAQRREIGGQSENEMYTTIESLGKHAIPLDPELRKAILGVLPELSAETEDILLTPPYTPFDATDAKVLSLARWFKNGFMMWRDPILCDKCQHSTEYAGSDEPTSREQMDGGGRVELHRCLDIKCAEITRFVRYSNPFTLLRTRTGRCGEWAHLFYEILRATGVDARYVWNSEDHVWTEYWSDSSQHWVHVDSCEATMGKPLLYARGWGKKQAFCLAVGTEGIEDVTKAYVDDWDDCVARRAQNGWHEEALAQSLAEGTLRLRLGMSREEIIASEERDRSHRLWLEDEPKRWREAERDDLGGRISGPADWRAARDELGETSRKIIRPRYAITEPIVSSVRTSEVRLLGDSYREGDAIVLTSRQDQVSGVFSHSSLAQSTSFRAELTFRLTAPTGSQGADGIALIFSAYPKLGEGGFGLGYTQEPAKTGDFAIEIDTFRSYDFAADPAVPHISVQSPPHAHHRHSIACTPPSSLPPLNDGKVCNLEVIYNGKSRLLQGWLRKEGEDEITLWEIKIPQGSPEEALAWYVGVTGATGGLWQKQEVLNLVLEEISIEDRLEEESDDV